MHSKTIGLVVLACAVVVGILFYVVKAAVNPEVSPESATSNSFPVSSEDNSYNYGSVSSGATTNSVQVTESVSTGTVAPQVQPSKVPNEPAKSEITSNPAPVVVQESVVAPAPVTHNISIAGFAFGPSSLSVKKGDTVVWTNNDSAPHTVTGSGLNSPTLGSGQKYTFTFNSAGTFRYHCNFHPSMQGSVTVAQ